MKNKLTLPLVSLVITNYNYSDYIEDCLIGILKQTYRPIECIIIDDCSTDNSVSVIEEFIKNHKNSDISYKLIRQETNQGQLAGFITGIKEAKGVFLGFVDADDIILPEFVNIHIQAHFRTNVAVSSSQQIEIDKKKQINSFASHIAPRTYKKDSMLKTKNFEEVITALNSCDVFEDNISYKVISIDTHKFGGWYWGPTSSVIFRKNVLDLFIFAENYEHWKYCADKYILNFAHLIGGSCTIYKPLTAYRRHFDNCFSTDLLLGNRKYFSQETLNKLFVNNKIVFKDILVIMLNGRENFLKLMDRKSFNNLIKHIIINMSEDQIIENSNIIKTLLNAEEYEKILLSQDNKQQV